MRLIRAFAGAYPRDTAFMLAALILANLAEGLGITTLLPLLSAAVGQHGAQAENARQGGSIVLFINHMLAAVGLTPTVGVLLVIVVLGMFFKGALVLLANRQVGYTVAHVATDLRLDLIHALLSTRWEYYLRQSVGALANSIATEANRAANGYLYGATMSALVIQSLVYVAIALSVSWPTTLVALGAGSMLLLLLNRFIRKSRRAGGKQTELLKSLLARLTDSLLSVKPLKAMARENLADVLLRDDTNRLNRALRKQVLSKEAVRALQDPMLAVLIASGLYVAIVYWKMSLPAIMVLVFLLARIMMSLNKVQRQYQQMMICESAYWSLRAAIGEAQLKTEPTTGIAAPGLSREIRLNEIGFRYRDIWVLKNVSLTIPAGGFVTLIGASGAGKTTLIDLLTALLEPETGAILIDGVALRDVNRKSWRARIGYVPQETFLLHDSIQNNVTLGDADLTADDAREALDAAEMGDFIASLPHGMQTIVGERGSMLSGGQRQRIIIARALAHRPRLLILDEATSALDPQSEAAISKTLAGLRGRLTIIAVSHQSALVDAADRVYRLHNGEATLISEPAAQSRAAAT